MLFSEVFRLLVLLCAALLVCCGEVSLLARAIVSRTFVPLGSVGACLLHACMLIGLAALAWGCLVEPYRLQVNTIDITTEKLKRQSLLVAHISDLHCDTKMRNEHKLVSVINAFEPDIIVFTGDALNSRQALGNFRATMKALKAKIGKFAVSGNWEQHYPDLDVLQGTGFIELPRSCLKLVKEDEVFFVCGLEVDSPAEADKVMAGSLPGVYTVFLHHTPDIVESFAGPQPDLYLCGHTHGGQVALPFYGALITLSRLGKKYEAGRYALGSGTVYVNRGVGMEGGPIVRIRLFARPEVALFRISPAPAHASDSAGQ